MQNSKILGILMVILSAVLIVLVAVYTILFSVFGIKSGGLFLMITPLLVIAIAIITALSFLFRAGIKQIKKSNHQDSNSK